MVSSNHCMNQRCLYWKTFLPQHKQHKTCKQKKYIRTYVWETFTFRSQQNGLCWRTNYWFSWPPKYVTATKFLSSSLARIFSKMDRRNWIVALMCASLFCADRTFFAGSAQRKRDLNSQAFLFNGILQRCFEILLFNANVAIKTFSINSIQTHHFQMR